MNEAEQAPARSPSILYIDDEQPNLSVFEAAYEHECMVTGRINELVETVMAERDHAANVFLQ